MPDIFNDFFDNSWMERTNYTAPAINVIENEKEYDVELAAPGLCKEDFQIHVDNEGNLNIRMEKKSESDTSLPSISFRVKSGASVPGASRSVAYCLSNLLYCLILHPMNNMAKKAAIVANIIKRFMVFVVNSYKYIKNAASTGLVA